MLRDDLKRDPCRQTRGAAETVYIMLQNIPEDRLERKTISLDCDTLYFSDVLTAFKGAANLNATFYFEDSGGKPLFSYLDIDSDSMVVDVREKVPISTHANTGAYAFATGRDLRHFCGLVIDDAVGVAGEFYLSSVIRKMLNAGKPFRAIHVADFACVGTPGQLSTFLQRIARNEIKCGRKMRFVFDLDNTLVTHPQISGDYATCEPKERNIDLVRELSAAGHYIIIWTARRMRTHNANVGAVIKDVGLVTLQTLSQFGIPYDEIHFGKPYADLYVDDLAVNALVDTEREIGWSCVSHKPSLERGVVEPRSFNSIISLEDTIIKTARREFLDGEIFFYRSIPSTLRTLFPVLRAVDDAGDMCSIKMERVEGVTAAHLVQSHALTAGRLLKILSSLERLHTSLWQAQDSAPAQHINMYANYADKLASRFRVHRDR